MMAAGEIRLSTTMPRRMPVLAQSQSDGQTQVGQNQIGFGLSQDQWTQLGQVSSSDEQNQVSNEQLQTIVVTGDVVPSKFGTSDTGVPDYRDFAPGALNAGVDKSLSDLTTAQENAAKAKAHNNGSLYNYWIAQGYYALGSYYYYAGYPSLNSYYSEFANQMCSNGGSCSGP